MSAPAQSRIVPALALPALLWLASACGAPQQTGIPEVCDLLTAEMTPTELNRQATCWGTEQAVDGSEACRRTQARVTELNRDAARGLGLCVLRSGERSDGAWIAEAIDAAADTGDALDGLLDAFAVGFEPATHRNSFSAALTQGAQAAIGARLGDLDADLRAELVDIAYAYSLDPLRELASPWMRELPADAPGVASYARELARTPGATLDETARWALAASGTWDGTEIIDCRSGDLEGCADLEGESPLALLEHAPSTMEPNPGPNRLMRLFHRGEMRADEAEYAARWLTYTDYPQRAQMAGSLFALFFNPEQDTGIRRAIGRGMGGSFICAYPEFLGAIYAHWSGGDGERSGADAPWTVLIDGCSPVWEAESLLVTLAAGPYLALDATTEAALRTRASEQLAERTCDDAAALAASAADITRTRFDSARLAWVETAEATGERCAETFAEEIRTTARDSDSHAFARLRAVEWMLGRGDTSSCGQIANALRYRNVDYNNGPGPLADALATSLTARCR